MATTMVSGVEAELEGIYLKDVKFRSDEQKEYTYKLRDVVLNKKAWCLIVTGTKGNGKSYLSKVAVNTFNHGGLAYYTTQPMISSDLWDENVSNGAVFKKLTSATVLVIDEMSDRPNDWTEFVKINIENILIERHRLGKATVLIGNVDMPRIRSMFDIRVRDRLKEGLIMVMNGESLRKEYGTV